MFIIKYLPLCALYCFTISAFLGINQFFTLLGIFCMLFVVFFRFAKSCSFVNKYYFPVILMMCVGATLNIFFTTNGLGGVFTLFAVMNLAISIIENPRLYLFSSKMILIFLLFLFYYIVLILQIDPNSIYVGMSRNYVGLLLVAYLLLYCILNYVINNKILTILPVIALPLSVLLVGRTSMIAIFLLCLTILLCFLKQMNFIVKLVTLITIIALLVYFDDDILLLYSASSFGGFGLDTPRYQLWKDFFRQIDFFTFIFGIDTLKIPQLIEYNGNIHNGFLNILARTGIGFVFFIPILLLSFFKYFKKSEYFLFILLGLFSIRAFFDTGIFIGNLGFIFYSLMLYPHKYYTIKRKNILYCNK